MLCGRENFCFALHLFSLEKSHQRFVGAISPHIFQGNCVKKVENLGPNRNNWIVPLLYAFLLPTYLLAAVCCFWYSFKTLIDSSINKYW